ncbi:MAG: hypothetical protein WA952_15830 [Lewinella sp.]
MTIHFEKGDNVIVIDDQLRKKYLLLHLTMVSSLVFFATKVVKQGGEPYGLVNYLYLILSGAIVAGLIYGFLRKTSDREIAVSQIERLRTRSILGNQRYSFLLSNGKVRDIPYVDSEVDRNKLMRITEEAGIPR